MDFVYYTTRNTNVQMTQMANQLNKKNKVVIIRKVTTSRVTSKILITMLQAT